MEVLCNLNFEICTLNIILLSRLCCDHWIKLLNSIDLVLFLCVKIKMIIPVLQNSRESQNDNI